MEDPLQHSFGLILQNHIAFIESFGLIAAIVSILVLLICSALVSGSEVAFFSLTPNDHDEIEKEKSQSSDIIQTLLEKPKRLLATILITNNFVNIAIVILSTYIANSFTSSLSAEIRFIIQIVVVAFLLLLLGEVIPKIYANKNPLKLATFMAYPIYYLRVFLKPFSTLLVKSTSFIDKNIKKKGHNISVNELSQALELTTDENESEEDHRILAGIVRFGNMDVKQVMTSRVDVVAISIDDNFEDIREVILDSGFSRLPVYKDSFDNIKGVLYIKDLLPHLQEETIDWAPLMRKPYFVPENKKIDNLLREFQSLKTHMAIVVDEYGGSSGVISLEDILEEIVGEISDEFDDDDFVYTKIDDYNYVFEGKTLLPDIYRTLGIEGDDFEAEKVDADTIAGFTLEIFGKIPQKNEKVKFNNYLLTIEAADKRRIKQVKITLSKEEENDQ